MIFSQWTWRALPEFFQDFICETDGGGGDVDGVDGVDVGVKILL